MIKRIFFILFSIAIAPFCWSQERTPWRLWYDHESGATWENALPIGNGRLGAMVYGNVAREVIQLNEHTVWSGSPNRNDNPDALAALPRLRQLIWEGKRKEAQDLANKVIISRKSHGQMFQPVGNLELIFGNDHQHTSYYRELDIERAVATTSYSAGDVTFTRETFASMTAPVIVMRIRASKPGALSFTATLSTPQPRSQLRVASHDLILSGVTSDHEGVDGKIKFSCIARVKQEGGQLQATDTAIVVSNADAVMLYVSMGTNFNRYDDIEGDENGRATANLAKVSDKPFDILLKEHVFAYQQYFNRVRLDLGTTNAMNLPTDIRLKNFSSTSDPQFAALYFQYGRYLLISSSQPGGQPANLQGIWNNKMRPPWDSKYTININAEMNYWPAEKTNLTELHEPFLALVKELSETGQETARTMYGARGWTAHHNTDIWRATGAVDGAFWGTWSAGGGWTSLHLWEHYLYNGDKAYLASVYPALKGAAMFYIDFLVAHPTRHYLVVNPDMSPENAPAAHQGSSIDAGTTMTNQIVFDVFSATIRAAETLHKDDAFADTLRDLRKRLAPMHIGQHGQLQEWLDDVDDPNDHHRHISHLYGLYPSSQISPYRTPKLFAAAKTTLLHRGDISTGWSMGWKVNWWARLHDGNHAYKLIQNQLTPVGLNAGGGGTYNNLFDAHPPFQIDGNFGCTAGIAEMLVQTNEDAIHLLPALPDAWPSGTVAGLRTKGGFEIVDMQWTDGKITKVIIKSLLGGNLRLRVPNALRSTARVKLKLASGKNQNIFYAMENVLAPVISPQATLSDPQVKETVCYDMETVQGGTYTLVTL
ncbi:MAG TPA: glycoside hydrolase family 95 protein [Ohtaekwangia sp.]|nr:glycoside hydrolase family 95 protein [Ohtaekwangia sp.]